MADVLLEVNKLHKRFGGVAATDGVNLAVSAGELHALIGPNGAGKTTLVAQLSGLLPPDSGTIVFDNKVVTGLPAHTMVKRGLARSFQITSVFSDMTLFENVALAVQASQRHSFRFWARVADDATINTAALAEITKVGLHDRRHVIASELSHGERRQLEIAMALATQPRLLLLDEPMAGMGIEESSDMIQLLKQLKGQLTIVLVEHDMDAVFALADRVSVLVYGKVIATGLPDEIKNNIEVRDAYLGER